MVANAVVHRQVDGMIAITRIEGRVVDAHASNDAGNDDVRVGIAIAVSIGGEIVLKEKAADLKKLGYRFAMVAGNARSKILRSLDAARSCFRGKAWHREWYARSSRIGG